MPQPQKEYPTHKEEAILKALKQYHYLTVDQVMLATNEPSLRRTQDRLLHLVKTGYIWRISRSTTEQNVQVKPAYTISGLAKIYLEEQGAVVLPARRPHSYTLNHALAINDILIRATCLERIVPQRYDILHLEHDRDLRVRKLNLPLVPDGFFEIGDQQRQQSFPFLLEADLDTEERVLWQEKIEKYLHIFGTEAKRVFDARHPRILCVTKTNHRKELKRWTEQVVTKREFADHERLFYFTDFPISPSTEELLKREYREKFLRDAAKDFFLTPHFFIGGRDEQVSLFDW